MASLTIRAVPARLGPEALALAWPERAPALNIFRPGQSHYIQPGSSLAWPRPGLLYEEYFVEYDLFIVPASGVVNVNRAPHDLACGVLTQTPNLYLPFVGEVHTSSPREVGLRRHA